MERQTGLVMACAVGTAVVVGSVGGCAASREACAVSRVPIVFTVPGDRETGELGGMAVPVLHQGRIGYLAIDTGSALTFLYLSESGPEFKRRAGRVEIGCERLSLPGRNFEAEDETGLGIVGVLGADYFLSAPAVFDPVHALIVRRPREGRTEGESGERRMEDAGFDADDGVADDRVTEVPFEDVEGHIIVTVSVDGRELRLMWDTGCPHLLWIGEDGRKGDTEIIGQDVEGGRFAMFEGRATLRLAGEGEREITVLRAPGFPYFAETVEALGGGIDGLAGQSVFGWRRMEFDADAGVIRLGPEDASP